MSKLPASRWGHGPIWIAAALLLAGLADLTRLPLLESAGMSAEGLRALTLILAAGILWLTEAIPAPVTAVLVLAWLPLSGLLAFPAAVAAFAGRTLWILIAVNWMALAVQHSGLHQRFARAFLRLGGNRPSWTVLNTILASLGVLFLVPIGVARTTLFTPLIDGMTASNHDRNFRRALFLGATNTSIVGAGGTMLGGAGVLYGVGLFEQMAGHTWTYASWLAAFFPLVFAYAVGLWLLLLVLLPTRGSRQAVEGGDEAGDLDFSRSASGPMFRSALIVGLFLGANLTVGYHGLPVEVISLAAGSLVFLPGMGLLSWDQAARETNWGTIFFFGASMGLASTLEIHGVFEAASRAFLALVGDQGGATVVAVLLVFSLVLRLMVSSYLMFLALILPVSFQVAAMVGFDPVWLGMLVMISGNALMLYPMQSPQAMVAYSAGGFRMIDMARVGVPGAVWMIALSLAAAYFFWPLLGYAP
ncbi:MAG: SLC13 family permease [Thermaerobacterales bacterium]